MGVPLLDLKGQYAELQEELDTAIYEVMSNAAFIGGPKVEELERAVAKFVGTDYAVSCASGTDALQLSLFALEIGEGDEVITTPFTFFATAEAIANVGATPVFVDIEPGTYNMDVSKVREAITERTKAIMPVHIFGQCVEMDALRVIAEDNDLLIIEDACQAIGATYRGHQAGSLGDAGCFSFFPSKNLGCAGDGGIVTTNDEELASCIRKLANHGTSKKYYHDAFGINSRLDALQAAILLVKLPHLNRWNDQRRWAAGYYGERLVDVRGIQVPELRGHGLSAIHLYILKAEDAQKADAIMDALKAEGIGTAKYYPLALHEQEVFTSQLGYVKPSLPVAESCNGRTFAIPCFPGITRDEQDEVLSVVKSAI